MRRRSLGFILAVSLAVSGMASTADPAQADPLPDAYTQIINHQIPINLDGTPTYTSWGRHYLGPNGWEIRLNSDATWNAIHMVTFLSSLGAGSAIADGIGTLGSAWISSLSSKSIQLAATGMFGTAAIYGDSLARQALLGNKCLGITIPYDPSLPDVLAREFDLMSGFWDGPAVGTKVWFEPCSSPSSAMQDHINPLVPLPFLQPAAALQPINYTADGTILHSANGSLYVMAGGAKFAFPSWNEFVSLGYNTNNMVNLDDTTLASIPNVPRDGTVLRSGGGNIYVVAGGAKFVFGSWGEFTGQGYGSYTNVPQAQLDQIGDAPGNKPMSGTVILAPNGSLSIVVGGVKFPFGSMTEYHSLGYTDAQMIRVSQAPYDAIPTASTANPPSNNAILRSGGGQVYVVAGGAKFLFGSMTEYANQGYASGAWINVPQAPLDAIGDAPGNMPKNGTVVLRPDGSLFVIAGGVRWHFSTMAEFSSEGYSNFMLVSQGAIDGIVDASATNLPANETLIQGTDSTVWVMKNGQRMAFTGTTQFNADGYSWSNIVRVPDAVLSGIPSGGYLS